MGKAGHRAVVDFLTNGKTEAFSSAVGRAEYVAQVLRLPDISFVYKDPDAKVSCRDPSNDGFFKY
jgi:hypothetical protein